MIDHYNAFISYKHAPEDNLVAATVQKELEHFHIPGKIRKTTGMKSIQRVFRDKEELTLTNDLSDTIANALANSDYLIVICSTNTKESMWVPKEIEYFLRNHTRNKIFTVLVNGEPEEVIPEILLEGTEPLSCDYRMPIKKANKTELPRLASAIIGCSYDELMNRRRQYKMHRIMIGFSIALLIMLGFSAYLIYSINRINENYIASLTNQSKYIAKESSNMLEREKRITALLLALEALPKSSEDDRPVTAEAVRALTKATLAYETDTPESVHDLWNYQMPNSIKDFKVSRDGSTLAAIDSNGIVAMWNTADHKRILYLENNVLPSNGIDYTSYNSMIVWNDQSVSSYDTNNGEEMWSCPAPDESKFINAHVLTTSEEFFLIRSSDNKYLKINSKTGAIEKTYELPVSSDMTELTVSEAAINEDFSKIAFIGMADWEDYVIGVLDLNTGKIETGETSNEYVSSISWVDNDGFVISIAHNVTDSSASFDNLSVLSDDNLTIKCIEAKDFEERWTADFTSNDVALESGFFKLPQENSVVFYHGNIAAAYDIETGKELYRNNLNDSIIDVSDANDDGYPSYVTSGGNIGGPISGDKNTATVSKYFTDDLDSAVVSNGIYVHQLFSYEIIYYYTHVYDTDWTPIAEDTIIPEPYNSYMDDNALVIIDNVDDKPVLRIYGFKDGAGLKTVELEEESAAYYKVLGTFKGKAYIAHSADNSIEIIAVDIATGEQTNKINIENYYLMDKLSSVNGGKLLYVNTDDQGNCCLFSYDLLSDKKSSIVLDDEYYYPTFSPQYYPEQNLVYIGGESNIIVDSASGKVYPVKLPKDWERSTNVTVNDSGEYLAISNEDKIAVGDTKGNIQYIFETPNVVPLGMMFYKDKNDKDREILLVAYSDGSLYRYASEDGSFIGKSDITTLRSTTQGITFSIDEENSLLYLQQEHVTDMVDINSWIETACISRCFGHHGPTDRFITYSRTKTKEHHLGYYKRYSTVELVEKAKKILGDAELTDEQKSEFGIDD